MKIETIKPINEAGSHRTGTISNTSFSEICEILGFEPNIEDDPYKVNYSWGALVNNHIRIGIWDYKQSYTFGEFSTYGNPDVFKALFGERYR